MSRTPAVSINLQQSTAGTRDVTNLVTGVNTHSDFVKVTGALSRNRPQSWHTRKYADGKYHDVKPWHHNSTARRTESLWIRTVGNSRDRRFGEAGPWNTNPTADDIARAQQQATQKAVAGIGDIVRNANVFLRELDDVFRLTKSFGNGVQSGLHNLIDQTRKSWVARQQMKTFLRHGWKEVPSFYLAYIFGIAPLAKDLENAVNAFNDALGEAEDFIFTVKGKSGFNSEYTSDTTAVYGGVAYKVAVARKVRGRATLNFKINTSALSYLNFVTPFSEAWETTRLSFVLDYILPVGGWLAALEGCQIAPYFRDGTASARIIDTPLRGYTVESPRADVSVVSASGYGNFYNRIVFDSFPYEAVFRPPRFRLPKIEQLGVVAALIGQRLNTLTKTIHRNKYPT